MKNQSFYTSLKFYFSIFIPILILLLTIGVFYFQKNMKKPIKIGFVGNLTGRLSNWGVSTRNGMLLLIEEINAAGGIRDLARILAGAADQNPQTDRFHLHLRRLAVVGGDSAGGSKIFHGA